MQHQEKQNIRKFNTNTYNQILTNQKKDGRERACKKKSTDIARRIDTHKTCKDIYEINKKKKYTTAKLPSESCDKS